MRRREFIGLSLAVPAIAVAGQLPDQTPEVRKLIVDDSVVLRKASIRSDVYGNRRLIVVAEFKLYEPLLYAMKEGHGYYFFAEDSGEFKEFHMLKVEYVSVDQARWMDPTVTAEGPLSS